MNEKIYKNAYDGTMTSLASEAGAWKTTAGYSYTPEIEKYDRLLAGNTLSNDSRDHISGVRAATADFAVANYVPMACELVTHRPSDVARLIAAIDHIVAQGHSTSADQAIDDAYYLAREIREEIDK